MSEQAIRYIGPEEIARRLTYDVCIPLVRDAMIAFYKRERHSGTPIRYGPHGL